MARGAFVIELRSDAVSEYVRHHRELPPALALATHESGIRNYSIFIHGSQAFGYFEADNVDAAIKAGAEIPAVVSWQALMAPLLQDGGAPLELLDEVFHLE